MIVTPASRFVRAGPRGRCRRAGALLLRPAGRERQVRWVVNQQPYFSPLRWNDDVEGGDSSYWYGDNQTAEGTLATRRERQGADQDSARRRRRTRRDFSARIEAQVTDAANREVSGRTIVHATYGTFFLSAEAGNTIHRGGEQVQVSIRALDYLGHGTAERAGDARARAPAVSIRLLPEPEVTPIATQNATTDASGRALVTFTLPNRTGSFRVRATAPSGERTVQDDVFLWVPGPGDYARRQRRSLSRAALRQAQLSAGRVGDADRARRNGDRPGAGHEGRPARVVVPAAAAGGDGFDPGADRRRRCRRRVRESSSTCAKGRLVSRRAAARCGGRIADVERGGDGATGGVAAARSGRLRRDGDRSGGTTGARAGQPRGDR